MGYGLEYQQPFFEDPTGAGDLLDEDEDEEDGWNGAYLPSAMEQTHSSRVAASTSPCSTYVSFFSNPSELVGPESLPPWTLSDSDSRISPTGSPSADFTAHGESLGDRHLRTLQISYEAVSEVGVVSAPLPGHCLCLSSILGGCRSPQRPPWPGVWAPSTKGCGVAAAAASPCLPCRRPERPKEDWQRTAGGPVSSMNGGRGRPSERCPSENGPLQAAVEDSLPGEKITVA